MEVISCNIDLLPLETIQEIALKCDFHSVIALARCNIALYQMILKSHDFWPAFYKLHFGEVPKLGLMGAFPLVVKKISTRWQEGLNLVNYIYKFIENVSNENITHSIDTPELCVFGGFIRDYCTVSPDLKERGGNQRQFTDIDLWVKSEIVHDELRKYLDILNYKTTTLWGENVVASDVKGEHIVVEVAGDSFTFKLDITICPYFAALCCDFDVNSLFIKTYNPWVLGTRQSKWKVPNLMNRAKMGKFRILPGVIQTIGSEKLFKRIEHMKKKGFVEAFECRRGEPMV